MINKEILQEIQSFYSEHIPDFSEVFEILKLDEETLVFKCKETNIKIVFNWKIIIDEIRHPHFISLLREEKYKTLLRSASNKDISLSNQRIIFLEDCGFFSKGYGEYLLTYTTWDISRIGMDDFQIGNVTVEISAPSNLYKCLFDHLTYDDTFDNWESFNTIKVRNCCKDELEGILQQVLFIIAKYTPPEIEGDYPEIIPFQYEGSNMLWNDDVEFPDSDVFPKVKHHEPLAFYNKGMKTNDPLFYYKILEYFFLINKKSEMQRLVEIYNEDSMMDKLMDSVTKIYVSKEDKLLENLLINIDDIDQLTKQAFENGLIQVDDVSSFSSKLYAYRNSIVHGKKDNKFELNVPTILSQNTNDNRWIFIIRTLAEKVIEQYC